MKFKVGDKVRILNAENIDDGSNLTNGKIYKIEKLYNRSFFIKDDKGEDLYLAQYEKSYYEIIASELYEEQRITTLEETVAKQGEEIEELKLIIAKIHKPFTDVEEVLTNDIIEFEGNQYKKVDREAREGDVVKFKNSVRGFSGYFDSIIDGSFHKVYAGQTLENGVNIYKHHYNRTPETVDVYELIVEDNHDVAANEWSRDYPLEKSSNELRAEIIEKAKKFIEVSSSRNYKGSQGFRHSVRLTNDGGFEITHKINFVVNEKKRTIVALIAFEDSSYIERKGIAKCMPDDVFNEHIGKAIALGRALGLDVSEFEQAVQPSEVVIGMKVRKITSPKADHQGEVTSVGTGDYVHAELGCTIGEFWSYRDSDHLKIINDTNAIYEVN